MGEGAVTEVDSQEKKETDGSKEKTGDIQLIASTGLSPCRDRQKAEEEQRTSQSTDTGCTAVGRSVDYLGRSPRREEDITSRILGACRPPAGSPSPTILADSALKSRSRSGYWRSLPPATIRHALMIVSHLLPGRPGRFCSAQLKNW
ncbi:uncharacterized protein V6R79_013070 [Siganus canaliculatus]